MELYYLKPGHKIRMRDGGEAEILSESEDGEWIRIRYLQGDDPIFAGTEDLAHKDDIGALLGVVGEGLWGDRVTVMLHRVPETEEYEGSYEAVTMTGVPHNVSVTGGDHDSPEDALSHLLDGLRTFGFCGRVAVDDATGDFGMRRYERDVSA